MSTSILTANDTGLPSGGSPPGSDTDLPLTCGKIALAGGAGFVILLVVAAVLGPEPPDLGATSAQNVAWFTEHRMAVLTQAYLRGLAVLLQLIFVTGVVGVLQQVRGRIGPLSLLAFAGATAHAALVIIANVFLATAALIAGSGITPDAVTILGLLYDVALTPDTFAEALLLGAVSLALLRARAAPRWVIWLGFAGVVVDLVAASAYPGSPIDVVGFFSLLVGLLWTLSVSVTLAIRGRMTRRA